MSYAESDDEDDEDAFDPAGISTQRSRGRGKPIVADDDDEEDTFIGGLEGAADDDGKPLSQGRHSNAHKKQTKWMTS